MVLEEIELINEQAYLVSRGVRHLALLGSIDRDDKEIRKAFVRLNQMAIDPAIPFVLPRKDVDCAMVGFASSKWVIDLLEWSYNYAPLRQRHCILGLLLGYSASTISEHDAREFAGNPNT